MIFTVLRYFALTASVGISIVLGVISLLRRRRNPVNLSFSIWAFTIAYYVAGVLTAVNSNHDLERAGFWILESLFAVVLVAGGASFFSFTFRYNGFQKKWTYNYAVTFGLCLIMTLILGPMVLEDVSQGEWNPIAKYAEPWYILSMIPLTVLVGQALLNLIKAWKDTTGLRRAQLEYVFFGIVLFWVAGSIVGFLLPFAGVDKAQGMSAALTITLTIPISYAMIVHRLFDISILARRILSGLVTLAATIGAFTGILYVASRFADTPSSVFNYKVVLICIILASLSVVSSGWLRNRIQRVIYNLERLAPGNHYLLSEQLSVFLRSVTGIERLLDHVLEKVTSGLEISHSIVYLPDGSGTYRRAATYGAYPEEESEPVELIVGKMKETKDIILKLDLAESLNKGDRRLLEGFESSEIEMAIPVLHHEDLIGFWTVGPKFSEDIYTAQDIGFFRAIAGQMSVGVMNSRLYSEVQEEKAHQRTILDNLPSGVLSIDTNGRIAAANRSASVILRREFDEMKGQRVELVSPVFYEMFRQTSYDGQPKLLTEVSLDVPNAAAPVPLSLSSLVLRNAEGEPIGCLLIFTDQSRIKQMEREVRRSENLAAMGRFAASIAHEIRNPLVSIKTFARLLPNRYEDEEFRTSFCSLADQEIDRIGGLVDHLLDLVRPSMVKYDEVDLRTILDKVLHAESEECGKNGIETIRKNWDTPSFVGGDGDKLRQVFINLVQNAVQAMESGNSLTVSIRRLDGVPVPGSPDELLHVSPTGTVVVEVQDQGTGIPPELINTIFEPFFTTREKGTGLGLSICHKIITDHGGKIFVTSTLGEGTNFTVCLPQLVSKPRDAVESAGKGVSRAKEPV